MTRAAGAWLVVLAAASLGACTRRTASLSECEALVDRFATLVVRESLPDAGAAAFDKERARQRAQAAGDPGFRACPEQVTRAQYACAMAATTSDALLACLE